MKKALKITGIVIGSLLILLLVLPLAFKGKIKEIIITQGNKMLQAEFTFESLHLSLLRNFPNATVSITDFALWGVDDFAGDTLASVGKVSATVNLSSLFGNSGFEVSRVLVSGATVRAIVLEDGRVNWDIMKPSESETPEAEEPTEASDFRIRLKRFTIDRTNLIYDDRQGKIYASVEDFGLICSGDMSADHTMLRLKTGIEKLNFRSGGIPYIAQAKVGLTANIDADLANMRFTFSDNTISFNAIQASIEGMFAMPGDGYDMDIRLKSEKVGFKEMLSMVPAIYAKEFSALQASGDVALTAWAKGRMTETSLPAFEASLDVTDGRFGYPSLPKSVDNIRIAASAKNPGGSADLTTIDVQPFRFSLAGNPFAATLHLATPISDPSFAVTAKGTIDLGMIREVYPLEDMELNGVFNADLDLSGRLSYIEQELYDRFQASGTLQVTDMLVQLKEMPDIRIDRSLFTFKPQYLQLSETTVAIGRSDLTTDCRLENYIGFALKGETIRGVLNVRSNLLDLNELMGQDATPETPAAEPAEASAPVAAFEVPKNIRFDMNTSLEKLYFDNLTLDDVKGRIVIDRGKLDMNNLSFNALGGAVTANGYYSTAADPHRPELNAAFRMQQVSFAESFRVFETIQKLAPVFENIRGSFSGDIALNTRLDSLMTPEIATLNGEGTIRTDDVSISGVKALDAIADAVKRPELKNIQVRDMDLRFTIRQGRVATQPFDIKVGNLTMNLSGSTGIDQTIDYTGKISLPESAGAASRLSTVDLKIGGTFDAPKVSLDTKGMVNQAVGNAVDMAADKALESLGNKLGVDLSEVENQRKVLIEQATKAGERLVEEAEKQSAALVEKANNALTKAAARVAGNKLVDEAKKQAEALVAKATEEGDKLVERARAGSPAASE